MVEQVMNESIRRRSLAIEMIDLSALRPYRGNARRHSRAQIKQIGKSIEAFGFTNPILVSDDLEILAGHGRAAAAQLIGTNPGANRSPIESQPGGEKGLCPGGQQTGAQRRLGSGGPRH